MLTAVPALAVGAAVIVSVLFEVASAQGELPLAVKTIVTLPAVINRLDI